MPGFVRQDIDDTAKQSVAFGVIKVCLFIFTYVSEHISFPRSLKLRFKPYFYTYQFLCSGSVSPYTQSILRRRVLLPELYDLMQHLGELLVRHADESIRSQCSALTVTFLLVYPLAQKRMQEQMEFLINNLTYEMPRYMLGCLSVYGIPYLPSVVFRINFYNYPQWSIGRFKHDTGNKSTIPSGDAGSIRRAHVFAVGRAARLRTYT